MTGFIAVSVKMQKNTKIIRDCFVNRNERFVPLQRQIERAAEAVIKDKNCES